MKKSDRKAYIDTFSSPDGKGVLGDILNRLGYYATDPSFVNPDLIAVANWLLAKMGINTPSNYAKYIENLVDAASFEDVIEEGE